MSRRYIKRIKLLNERVYLFAVPVRGHVYNLKHAHNVFIVEYLHFRSKPLMNL